MISTSKLFINKKFVGHVYLFYGDKNLSIPTLIDVSNHNNVEPDERVFTTWCDYHDIDNNELWSIGNYFTGEYFSFRILQDLFMHSFIKIGK